MKYLLLSAIGLFSAFGICMAQTWTVQVEAKLDASKLEEANADLSQIEIDFCDKEGEKSVTYTMTPWWSQDICYKATNASDRDIQVTVGFVDGTFTNDQRKNKACMQQGDIKEFWKYVTDYAATFIVGAKNISYQHATLRFPTAKAGTVNGCLVYYTKGVEVGGQMNFTVLMRKAKFIDVTIRDKASVMKDKARWLIFGIIVLLLFFMKFRAKPKKLPKK